MNKSSADNELAIVLYKFFYKDSFGLMKGKIIEVLKKDNELAIAAFEKQFPDITWRSFIIWSDLL